MFAHLGGWQRCILRVASEHKLETREQALKRWGRALQRQGTASGRLEVARLHLCVQKSKSLRKPVHNEGKSNRK